MKGTAAITRLCKRLLVVAFAFLPALSARSINTIAISYFDNTSEDIRYASLSKGIADMLITDLSKVKELNIVERENLEKLLKEIELGQSKYFDNKTAQKLGKGLGAEAILTGAFMILEDNMRIDARLVDVASGKILAAEAVTGAKSDFFSLHKQLVALLVKELKMKNSPEGSSALPAGKVDLSAVLKYSNALDYYDKGLSENASELLASTVSAYPQFTFAKDRLEKLKEWLKKAEEERKKLLEQETQALLSNLNKEDPQMGQKINQIWTSLLTSFSYSGIIAINKQLRENGFKEESKLYGEASPITFGEMMLYYNALSFYSLKHYQDLLKVGQDFITKYPTSMYYSGIKMYMDESIKELEAREKGKAAIDAAVQMAEFETYIEKLDALTSHWRLKYMTRDQYEHYKGIFTRRVLNFGDEQLKKYVTGKGDKAYELFEFKEIAAHFLDAELLDLISKKAVKVYTGTDLEDSGFRIEEWVEREKSNIASIRSTNVEAHAQMKTGKPADVNELAKDLKKLDDALDWSLIEKICRAYLALPAEANYTRRDVWEHLVTSLVHQGKLDEALAELTKYEEDKVFAEKDPVQHKQQHRQLRSTFNDAKKTIQESRADLLSIAIYKERAETYEAHHQFAEEALTRRQLLDNFELDETESSVQLYSLVTAYTNLGYFDKALSTAKELQKKYPGNSFSTALEYTIKYMPH